MCVSCVPLTFMSRINLREASSLTFKCNIIRQPLATCHAATNWLDNPADHLKGPEIIRGLVLKSQQVPESCFNYYLNSPPTPGVSQLIIKLFFMQPPPSTASITSWDWKAGEVTFGGSQEKRTRGKVESGTRKAGWKSSCQQQKACLRSR